MPNEKVMNEKNKNLKKKHILATNEEHFKKSN